MAMYSASLRTVVARACFRFPSYPMRNLTGFFSSVLSSFSHGISVDWSLNFPVTYDGGSHTLSVRTFMFNVCKIIDEVVPEWRTVPRCPQPS